MKVPVNSIHLSRSEIRAVKEAVKQGWVSSSSNSVKAFEQEWANYCGRSYGVAVSNGTAALELSIRSLGIGPGDEVIIPNLTIISCASAVVLAGATPVAVDVESNFCLSLDKIRPAITKNTKAIIAVHLYGQAAAMHEIEEFCRNAQIYLIEDAAEFHGGEIQNRRDGTWKRAGSFGDLSVFSFFANKLITTGEGGMVLCNDATLKDRLSLLRNLAFENPRYLHTEQGFNYRLSGIQASLGLTQIPKMKSILQKKKRIYEHYLKLMSGLNSMSLFQIPNEIKSSYWVFPVLAKNQKDRDYITSRLSFLGVETRNFFIPMSEQPVLLGKLANSGELSKSEFLSKTGFYLPSGLGLTRRQIQYVARMVRKVDAEVTAGS